MKDGERESPPSRKPELRQAVPAVWVWTSAVAIFLSALVVADPLIGTIFFLSVFLLAVALFRLDAAIMVAIVILFFFYRFEIQHARLNTIFFDVFVISAVPITIPYLFWWMRRGAGIDHPNDRNYVNTLIVMLIAWGGISYWWTKDAIHGLVLTSNMIFCMMIVQLLVVTVKNHAAMRRTLVFFILLGCVLGVYTIATKFYDNQKIEYRIRQDVKFVIQSGGEGLDLKKKIRANGFARSDLAGFSLNMFIFITLAFLISGTHGGKRFLAFLALIYLLTCLVLTGSKGALAGLLVGIPVAIFTNPALKRRKINWMIVMMLLVVFAFLANYVVFKEDRISKSISGGTSTKIAVASFSSRLKIWNIGLDELIPTYGLGLGNGTSVKLAEKRYLPHMHSLFCSVLFDLGFTGLAIYLGIITKVGLRLNKMRRDGKGLFERSLAACLAGSLTAAVAQGALISEYPNHLFWIVIGLIVAVTSLPPVKGDESQGLPHRGEPLHMPGKTA